jgi:hypothetical protein
MPRCDCAPVRPMAAACSCPHPIILPSRLGAAVLQSVRPAAGSRAPSTPRLKLPPAPSCVGWARWLLRCSLSTVLPPELPLAPWWLACLGISPLLSPVSDERRALSSVLFPLHFRDQIPLLCVLLCSITDFEGFTLHLVNNG